MAEERYLLDEGCDQDESDKLRRFLGRERTKAAELRAALKELWQAWDGNDTEYLRRLMTDLPGRFPFVKGGGVMIDQSDKMSLGASIKHGVLTIRIGVGTLAHAAAHHPEFWDGESGLDKPNIPVTDKLIFARAVLMELQDEEEDGTTMLHRLFDEAMKRAVENGCEGVDETWVFGQ